MPQKSFQERENRDYPVTVTGGNVQVTDAMKLYAIEKVRRIERFSDRIIDVKIFMDIQKLGHTVHISMRDGHLKVASHAVSTDMYASIDDAVKKIERQLKRNKDKISAHQARSLTVVDVNVNVLAAKSDGDLAEINEEIEAENARLLEATFDARQVVSKEKMTLKTLTQKEAVLRMDLSGDAFLLYRSEEDQQLKLVYRRRDGQYAVVEPETIV